MSILHQFKDQNEEIAQWRQQIHQHPETAFEEFLTAEFVSAKLREWGVPHRCGFAGTGVVATIEGETTTSGRAIALRADMDALPIHEETGLTYESRHDGKMHACGHDGHTAMLLSATRHLAQTRSFNGTVYVVFQPAEENGYAGANEMIKSGFFEQFPCEAIFGLHNWPWLPVGTFAISEGPMTASTDEFEITIHGQGGHAAFPHVAVDSVLCGAHLVTALQSIVSRTIDPSDAAVVSVTQFQAGSGCLNTVPERSVLGGTLRTFKPEVRAHLLEQVTQISAATGAAFGAKITLDWHGGYPAVINSAPETRFARKVAASVVGAENVHNFQPTMGGEDFAFFLQHSPGAYIALGQGKTERDHGLHSPHYDFNDDALPYGAAYWVQLAEKWLSGEVV